MTYEKIGVLNKGAYGIIYDAKKNGKEVVVKRVIFEKRHTDIVKGILGVREVDFARSLNHPYILSGIEFLDEKPFTSKLSPRRGFRDDKIYLVFPKARYTLNELIYECITPISHLKRAMYQMLVALDYLHSKNICHRDIKPDNVLCFYDNGILTTKLCDFGMSKPLLACEKNSTHAVTSVYRPPEILLGNRHYDLSIDIWAMGISFYEMVMKKDMFKESTSVNHLQSMFKIFGTPTEYLAQYNDIPTFKNYKATGLKSLMTQIPKEFNDPEVGGLVNTGTWDQFIDLLTNMLQLDPTKRFTPIQCMKHPFFSEFYKQRDNNYNLIVLDQEYPREKWSPVDVENKQLVIDTFTHYFDEFRPETFRVLFLAIDIFIRLQPKMPKMEDLDKYCIYMAFKFFFDIQSPEWNEIFTTEPKKNISKIECQMLKQLDYIVYRPIIWDEVMNNPNVDPLQVMKFMCEKTDIKEFK